MAKNFLNIQTDIDQPPHAEGTATKGEERERQESIFLSFPSSFFCIKSALKQLGSLISCRLWPAHTIASFSMSLLTCVFMTKHIVWRPGRFCGDLSRWKILKVFLCYTLNIWSACTIEEANLSQINTWNTFNISIMFSTLASFVWGLTSAHLIMSFSCVLFFCNGLMV